MAVRWSVNAPTARRWGVRGGLESLHPASKQGVDVLADASIRTEVKLHEQTAFEQEQGLLVIPESPLQSVDGEG